MNTRGVSPGTDDWQPCNRIPYEDRDNHLLLIGVNQYRKAEESDRRLGHHSFSPCPAAVNDIEAFEDLLIKDYGIQKSNIRKLIGPEATMDAIVSTLEHYVLRLSCENNLIVLFCGHGHANDKLNMGYWIPYDALEGNTSSYLEYHRLDGYFKKLSVRHLLIISDSCYGGRYHSYRSGSKSQKRRPDHVITKCYGTPSRWIIASGMEKVLDHDGRGNRGKLHSPFMNSLLHLLETFGGEFIGCRDIAHQLKKISNLDPEPVVAPLADHEQSNQLGEMFFRKSQHSSTQTNKTPPTPFAETWDLEPDTRLVKTASVAIAGICFCAAALAKWPVIYSSIDPYLKPFVSNSAETSTIEELATRSPSTYEFLNSQSNGFIRPLQLELILIPNLNVWIAKVPVTRSQFAKVMGNKAPSPVFKNSTDNHPQVLVSWDTALIFCQLLTAQESELSGLPEGYAFTLPMASYWDIACFGAHLPSSIVDSFLNPLPEFAWFSVNANNTTHQVGIKKPNQLGLQDMLGNVFEWCIDLDPTNADCRIIKGGCWDSPITHFKPGSGSIAEKTLETNFIGFRICLQKSIP